MFHLKALTHFLDARHERNSVRVHRRIVEMNTLKEEFRRVIGVFFTVDNTTSVTVQELRKGGNDAIGVGTVHTEDGVRLGGFLVRRR